MILKITPQKFGIALLIFSAVFLSLAVWQFLSLPQRSDRVAAQEQKVSLLKAKGQRLSLALSDIKTIETDLDLLKTALPSSDNVPTLMTQIESLAKSSGLTVQQLGFVTAKETGKIPLTVVATGTYPALQAFLASLEQTSRVVTVSTLRFSPAADEKEAGGSLSITLGVVAYFTPEDPQPSPERELSLDISSPKFVDLIKKIKVLRVYQPETGL